MDQEEVRVGDIVLYRLEDGSQIPGIIDRLDSQQSAVLTLFGNGGAGGSADTIVRGDQPGQWQPRPRHT